MENIRMILLLVGAVIVLGIYLYGRLQAEWARRPKREKRRKLRWQRDELPELDDLDSDLEIIPEFDRPVRQYAGVNFEGEDVPAGETTVIRSTRPGARRNRIHEQESKPAAAEKKPASAGKIFSLFVMAPAGVPYRGTVLLDALEDAFLEFGEMQIFHRNEVIDGRERHLFSAANIREPGIFDLSNMENFSTEGLVLFLQVTPGVDAVRAFDAMVESARIIAEELGGTVCDATRSFLTKQTIGHLREEVIGCQLQQRVMKTGS